MRKAHPSEFGANNHSTGRKILAATHERLPTTTNRAAQPVTGLMRELIAMKAAMGIRLAPAQNRRPAGICVNPAIGTEPSRRSTPIAAQVAASSASKSFSEENESRFVMVFLIR